MSHDPLARIPTTVRLWFAAVLAIVPLGLVWSTSLSPGMILFGDCSYSEGPYCVPDQYVAGSVSTYLASQAPVRVFLVFAALVLAGCAAHPRTAATQRLARAATGALAIAAALAAGNGATRVLICVLGALVLAAPPSWSAGNRAFLASEARAR